MKILQEYDEMPIDRRPRLERENEAGSTVVAQGRGFGTLPIELRLYDLLYVLLISHRSSDGLFKDQRSAGPGV